MLKIDIFYVYNIYAKYEHLIYHQNILIMEFRITKAGVVLSYKNQIPDISTNKSSYEYINTIIKYDQNKPKITVELCTPELLDSIINILMNYKTFRIFVRDNCLTIDKINKLYDYRRNRTANLLTQIIPIDITNIICEYIYGLHDLENRLKLVECIPINCINRKLGITCYIRQTPPPIRVVSPWFNCSIDNH